MRILAGIASLVLLLTCSCANHGPKDLTTGSGNLGVFIFESAMRYGGHPTTNAVPVVETEWRYRPDANGIVIHLVGNRLPDVQSILSAAFGDPDTSCGSKALAPGSPPGRQNGYYSHEQLGISIYIWGDKEETGVIILRGKT